MVADVPPTAITLVQLQAIYDRPAYSQSAGATTGMKIEALEDVALSIGIKGGLRMELVHIGEVINAHARELDSIYNFSTLMINDRVVPPVITEARDLYNQDGNYALRLSGAYYRIEKQAKFSSVPPNWREYLTIGPDSAEDDPLATTIRPVNDEERQIFHTYLAKGWQQGVEQADIMLQYGLDRLNRDFLGMLRFHTFVLEHKITMPVIASRSWQYSSEINSVSVDETLLRITTLPEFTQPDKWKASIKSSNLILPRQAQPTGSMHRISPKLHPCKGQRNCRSAKHKNHNQSARKEKLTPIASTSPVDKKNSLPEAPQSPPIP